MFFRRLIDEQDPELLRAEQNRTGARFAMDWTRFYTFDEINAFIDEIVSRNANLSIIDIGQSFERRPLRVVRFSSGPVSFFLCSSDTKFFF